MDSHHLFDLKSNFDLMVKKYCGKAYPIFGVKIQFYGDRI